MNKSVAHSILKLYADDSLLYKPILNSTDSDLFQIDLNSLVGWADAGAYLPISNMGMFTC